LVLVFALAGFLLFLLSFVSGDLFTVIWMGIIDLVVDIVIKIATVMVTLVVTIAYVLFFALYPGLGYLLRLCDVHRVIIVELGQCDLGPVEKPIILERLELMPDLEVFGELFPLDLEQGLF
jgi:hypothetical protein